jgi:long-subunit acyl-CoA synthetase (AMP-forming)
MKPRATAASVSQAVHARAFLLGERPALTELPGGAVVSYRRLAESITEAAAGLVWRGARIGQVAGVYVDTLTAQILATHTVIAAGGAAVPVGVESRVPEMADLLARWDARLLFTTPKLAAAAVEAADSSRVRQVVSIGAAPDTIDFDDLLRTERSPAAPGPLIDPGSAVAVIAEGCVLTHRGLLARMREMDRTARLTADDVLLVTWPLDGGADVPVLVSLALMRGATIVAAPGLPADEAPETSRGHGVTVTTALDDGRKVITRIR